jgi:hypothetical protein
LADIAHHISSLKGEANVYLLDPNYGTLRFRLEKPTRRWRQPPWRQGGGCA